MGIGGRLCQMLLYAAAAAADIVVMAARARDLQRQLDALQGFCADSHMQANVQ